MPGHGANFISKSEFARMHATRTETMMEQSVQLAQHDSSSSSGGTAAVAMVRESTFVKTPSIKPEPESDMSKTGLFGLHQLPDWYSFYPYILHAYRLPKTTKEAFRSLYSRDNETFNVWTEFGPALILFLLCAFYAILDDAVWRSQPLLSVFIFWLFILLVYRYVCCVDVLK